MAKKDDDKRGLGLVGAAERAPLTQGKDGSIPVTLEDDDDDLTRPDPTEVDGAPTERQDIPSPIAEAPEEQPVPTGEKTIERVRQASRFAGSSAPNPSAYRRA
jgi:hypothetical protein